MPVSPAIYIGLFMFLSTMQLLKMNLSLSLLVLLLFIEVSSSSSNVKIKKAYEFTANNITTNYDDWESDLAIMFYAPWYLFYHHYHHHYNHRLLSKIGVNIVSNCHLVGIK